METKIINKFECPDCGMEFVAETSRAGCPKCGGICDASSREIFDPGAFRKPTRGKITFPRFGRSFSGFVAGPMM